MNTAVTTIYAITDDGLKSRRHKESAQCTVSDADVMTVPYADLLGPPK
jgi:hypothetical protein